MKISFDVKLNAVRIDLKDEDALPAEFAKTAHRMGMLLFDWKPEHRKGTTTPWT
jgi:hypothetical protein